MRKAHFAALLLVVFICSLGAVPAKADTVSWLTGNFSWLSPDFFYGYFSTNNPNFPQGDQYVGANVHWASDCNGNLDCIFFWPHVLGKTEIDIFDQNGNQVLTFNGWIAGEASETVLCDQIECYSMRGEVDYAFAGAWSNGWYSSGYGDVSFDSSVGSWGGFQITTNVAPEPSSLALLGSGVLGLIGYGRKRLGM